MVDLYLVSHAVAMRRALARDLDDSAPFDVVGQCSSGAEALVQVPRANPDLVLVTQVLPDTDGATFTRDLRAAGDTTPVLLLSGWCDAPMLGDALQAGASGVALVWKDIAEMTEVLSRAARGEVVAPAAALQDVLAARDETQNGPRSQLAPQELEVFDLVGTGLTNPEIAARLHLSHGTVRNYVAKVMSKTGMNRRADIVTYVALHPVDAAAPNP